MKYLPAAPSICKMLPLQPPRHKQPLSRHVIRATAVEILQTFSHVLLPLNLSKMSSCLFLRGILYSLSPSLYLPLFHSHPLSVSLYPFLSLSLSLTLSPHPSPPSPSLSLPPLSLSLSVSLSLSLFLSGVHSHGCRASEAIVPLMLLF